MIQSEQSRQEERLPRRNSNDLGFNFSSGCYHLHLVRIQLLTYLVRDIVSDDDNTRVNNSQTCCELTIPGVSITWKPPGHAIEIRPNVVP